MPVCDDVALPTVMLFSSPVSSPVPTPKGRMWVSCLEEFIEWYCGIPTSVWKILLRGCKSWIHSGRDAPLIWSSFFKILPCIYCSTAFIDLSRLVVRWESNVDIAILERSTILTISARSQSLPGTWSFLHRPSSRVVSSWEYFFSRTAISAT